MGGVGEAVPPDDEPSPFDEHRAGLPGPDIADISDPTTTSSRYRDDAQQPARLNSLGLPEPTRQPRFGNRLYCMVWTDHDLFKIGLSSGSNARNVSAVHTITRYLGYESVAPGSFIEWRAEVSALEGAAWGDCQRLEMVFATALKRRLGASAAGAVGLEWLTHQNLEQVDWKRALTDAAVAALEFSALDGKVEWTEYTPNRPGHPGTGNPRTQGRSQLDAHRTMRNQREVCALKGCGAPVHKDSSTGGRFRYCSDDHARSDARPHEPATD